MGNTIRNGMSGIGNTVSGIPFGAVLQNNWTIAILWLIATVLLIASMVVPYYTDGANSPSGIFSNRKCLGFVQGTSECTTMEALPAITAFFGCLSLVGIFAVKILAHKLPNALGFVHNLYEINIRSVTALAVFVMFTILFSVVTLITQLSTPITISGSTVSLADQSQKACNSQPITFKDGMALSAASTALYVFILLIFMSNVENLLKFFNKE